MRISFLALALLIGGTVLAEEPAAVVVQQKDWTVTIENGLVSVSYNLADGTWNATDKKRNCAIITHAATKLGEWSSSAAGVTSTFKTEPLGDALGLGRSLLVSSSVPGGPTLLLRISLYNDLGILALSAGLENTTDKVIQLTEISPLDGGAAFKGFDLQSRYSTLDGFGGGAKTAVMHTSGKRTSLNNMLATFGEPGKNRSLVLGGLTYAEFEKYAEVARDKDSLQIRLYAKDPVGKRIDPASRYLINDRFYVDFLTDNPFDALESYANNLRLAQNVVLPVCRFPIVDTWFAQVPHFGGGEDRAGYRAQNDSVGAVEEMECVVKSGFLKYSTVAVLIEPDLYESLNDKNTQQGWWDDEHWQRGPSNRAKGAGTWSSSHGQFVPPYETARKWAGAVKALGGIPMIYVQTGFRSQDYADKFPGHMLYNQPNAPHLNDKGEQLYRDKEKKYPRKLGYDYTDPGFIAHLREVWENLRLAGVQGVKFDYPDFPFTGWPRGGMEDPYATTAMHYRNIFRLAHDGLGPGSYIHERTLDRGSDVTLGLVASQRTEGDTDLVDKTMLTRVGLRWYKNRVVVNYDMDGKNPFHALPRNRDGERALMTMSYVVSGTLMIVPSFGRMTAEQLYDLSRLYPYHSIRQSARPVDAFTSAYPQVYDFKVTPQWRQVTFYNTDPNAPATVGVDLSGDTAFGGLGLDHAGEYYVYDFWNNCLAGRLSGGKRLEQTLRPGEARMMSVRQAEPNPQVLSTDRHVMQGCVDLLGSNWDAAGKKLKGVSAVVGGEPYRVIIATNGQKPVAAAAGESIEHSIAAKSRVATSRPVTVRCGVRMLPGEAGLAELSIERSDNGPVAWSVTFEGK